MKPGLGDLPAKRGLGMVSQVVAGGLLVATVMLGGCKIVSIEADRELRAQRSGTFDAPVQVRRIWASRVVPYLEKSAVPIAELNSARAKGLDGAGARLGRKASDGAPWTFVVKGEGRVAGIDRASRAGSITLTVTGMDAEHPLIIEMGPVIVDTAIRDSLPFLNFNDFADQIAFANLGRALTARALADVRPVTSRVRVGERISFLGVTNLAADGNPTRIMPIALRRLSETGQ